MGLSHGLCLSLRRCCGLAMEGNRGVEGGICLVVADWIWCGLEAATDHALGESGPIVVPWSTSC